MTAKPMTAEEIEAVRTKYSGETFGHPDIDRLLATVDALKTENAAMREALAKIIKAGEYPAPDGMVRIAREALEPKP